jgi:hypothetical protein
MPSEDYLNYFPLVCLCGFNEGVFPGVCLLSRWRLSGCPVDSAIFFGPGLIPIVFVFLRLIYKSQFSYFPVKLNICFFRQTLAFA